MTLKPTIVVLPPCLFTATLVTNHFPEKPYSKVRLTVEESTVFIRWAPTRVTDVGSPGGMRAAIFTSVS